MKACRKCLKVLSLEAFHKDKASKDGYRPRCKACIKAYDDTRQLERNRRAREIYAANPEPKKLVTRQYHLDHPEWSKERLRAHHVANRDQRYQKYVERGKDDPQIAAQRREATRRAGSRRRAIIKNGTADLISEEQFAARLEEFDHRCYICELEIVFNLHWDHYRPLAAGGEHTISNLFPACDLCNIRKSACWPFTDRRKEEIRREVRELRSKAWMSLDRG